MKLRKHIILKIREKSTARLNGRNFAYLKNEVDFYGQKINRADEKFVYLKEQIVPISWCDISSARLLDIFRNI